MILIVFLIESTGIFAQNSNFKDKFSDADYYFLFEEYSKALKIYLELLKTDNSNANINYLTGLCYVQSVKDRDKTKAIPYLVAASKNINPKYKEGKYKETTAPVYTLFYLAFAYRLDRDFDKAIETYKTYISFLNPKDKKERENAMIEIEACEYAKQLIKTPISLESVKIDQFADTMKSNQTAMLDESVSSGTKSDSARASESIDKSFISATSSESCPIVSNDGTFMIFSMGENNQFPQEINTLNFDFQYYKTDDIYYTTKAAGGQWDKPVNIIPQLKPKYQLVPVCLSPDGKTLYLVEDDNDNGNIYESRRENNTWSAIEKVKGDINTRQWETHASISADGKTMYFTSARSGGFGGLDIYKSVLNEKGEWGKAENLGPNINSPGDEETPSILADGKTLFFSSKGKKGIGGFDIFSSTLGSDGQWSVPLNAGYSINTVKNDFVYINKVDNQLAYTPLTRTDMREEYSGKEDKNTAYVLTVNAEKPTRSSFEIRGTVVFRPGDVKMPGNYKICIIDSAKKDTVKNLTVSYETGEYSFNSTSGTYFVKYIADGYREYTHNLSLPDIYTPSTLTVNVEMLPVNDKSVETAHADVIFDYEKNIPNLNKKRNVNLAAYKNRDSLRLVAENNFRQRETLADVNKNMVGMDTSANEKHGLVAEKKNMEKQDNKNQLTEKQGVHTADKNLVADNKNDEKINQGKQNNKNTKSEQDNKNLKNDNSRKQNDQAGKNNLTAEHKSSGSVQSSPLPGSTIIKNVLFDFDCLKPKAFRDNLDALATYLVNNKNCKIRIDGHSDSQGDEYYKQIVSEMRADFIKKYLADKGALKSNMVTKGQGSGVPIAKENLPETRQYNRRAEFTIIENCEKLYIQPIIVPDLAKRGAGNNAVAPKETAGNSNVSGITVHDLLYNIDYLNPRETTNIDLLAGYLLKNPSCEIEIIGHSDSQGEAGYKQFVSEQRAANIKKQLVKKGVNPANISVRGESDSKPVSINDSDKSRQFNRRVEFRILKEGAQKLVVQPVRVPEKYRIK